MTVYKRPDSRFYRYDFTFRGARYSGSTERTTKRDAEAAERGARERVKQEFAGGRAASAKAMTIKDALDRYWLEVGQHASDAAQIVWSSTWLEASIGAETPIRDITNELVARLVAARRVERSNRGAVAQKRAKGGKVGLQPRLSPATVNRSVTQPLRRVLKRAAELWGEQVQPVRWRDHMLGEPQERVRYMSAEEEAAVFAVLPPCYQVLAGFAALAGCRASECIRLTWADIDWGERRITIVGKGWKGVPKVRTVVLSAAMRELLWPLKGDAPRGAAIFRNMTGDPATYRSYSQGWVTACRRAGVTGLRVHDLRHTAATRLLRSTGNLKMAQRLLGHSNISTTAKYAHVLDDDLRAAMDAMTAQQPDESHTTGSHRKAVTP